MRKSPQISISQRPYDCTLLAQGWDTFEEVLSVFIFKETWTKLDAAKKYAYEQNKKLKGKNQAYSTLFCGIEFQIKGHGGDGVTFILENPDFTISIRPAKTPWNVSITYRSCALWQYGLRAIRQRLFDALSKEMNPRPQRDDNGKDIGWQRVSRADYAFDFHSPEFTGEISHNTAGQIVCHSSSKIKHDFKSPEYFEKKEDVSGYVMGTSARVQTLTLGNKANLELQIYDKTAEITEASGKTWMYKVWEQSGFAADGSTKDVWRLEVRMGRTFLNNRSINTLDDLEANRELLLSEALTKWRLTEPSGKDTNKRRWPVHPLWGQAIELSGELKEMLPIGKQREYVGEVVDARAKREIKAGLRKAVCNRIGDWDEVDAANLIKEIMEEIAMDEDHSDKIEMYNERYKYTNCAK